MLRTKKEYLQEVYKKTKKQYIHFLKFTRPNVEEYPSNLLELLNHAYKRKMKVKNLLNNEN